MTELLDTISINTDNLSDDGSVDSESMECHLDYQLGKLEPPKYPEDPKQMQLPLGEDAYDYGTVQIEVSKDVAALIQDWGRVNIPEDCLWVKQPVTDSPSVYDDANSPESARETDTHVTVKYGLTSEAGAIHILHSIAAKYKPFPIFIGNVSLFEQEDHDVVKLNVESPVLRELNADVSGSVPCKKDDYPEYVPHVTLAYVKKGSCNHLVGKDVFEVSQKDPDFIAYDMTFRGPGEEGDQLVDTIPFDRAKDSPEAVL